MRHTEHADGRKPEAKYSALCTSRAESSAMSVTARPHGSPSCAATYAPRFVSCCLPLGVSIWFAKSCSVMPHSAAEGNGRVLQMDGPAADESCGSG